MSSERSCWEIYNKEMSQLNHGHALWEPAPLSYFRYIQPGDVGYIRTGGFHLLFSAGLPLGQRKLGVDVPLTFKQLDVGPIVNRQPRLPGISIPGISTPTISYPMLEPGRKISFRLVGEQGVALVTRYQTHREDVQRTGTFENYVKRHYTSWVAFARETGHGNDINPVLVTGVDRTKDFAMMSYSNDDDDDDLRCEFTTSIPGGAFTSVWGTWHTTGFIHTNCGPQLHHSPSPTQIMGSTPSGINNAEPVSDEYDQCVFVRYYTMRKRLGIPKIIKAGAGPHDLGSGDREDEGSPEVEARSPSNSSPDTVSSFCDDDGDNDRSSVTSIESEPDIVVHNTTADEKDGFDVVADYVFRNSDADFVLIHHRDIALLHEPGDSMELSVRLLEKRPQITVDGTGVGTIGGLTGPSAGTWFSGIAQPTPALIPIEIEREATDRVALPEPRPPSTPEYHPQSLPAIPEFRQQPHQAPDDNLPIYPDIYSHPAAVAYAAAHPRRTIPKFGSYLLLQTLGEGEFGKVKLGLHMQWGEEVIVRLIRRGNTDTSARMSRVEREIEALRVLKHPNIIRLYDVIETDKYIGIILEYASGGELFDHILAHRYLKEKDACKLFAQLISGVWYAHQKKFVHRGLKLETLLLDQHKNVIITGFGFANRFEHKADELMQTSCGSPLYAAPELVVSDGMYVGSAVDIWSCGVILYAMLAGYLPFDDDPANSDGENINLLYKYIINTPLSFPDYISAEARDLLSRMLVPDPKNRADIQTVMNHQWLRPYAALLNRTTRDLERETGEKYQQKRLAYLKRMDAVFAATIEGLISRGTDLLMDLHPSSANLDVPTPGSALSTTPVDTTRTPSAATDKSFSNPIKRRPIPSPRAKNIPRVRHGEVDPMTITSSNPPEVMKHVSDVLLEMGLEVQKESQYIYVCVRPKKRKIGSTGVSLEDGQGGNGLTAFMISGAASGGVDKRVLPVPSSSGGMPKGLLMRRQPSQVSNSGSQPIDSGSSNPGNNKSNPSLDTLTSEQPTIVDTLYGDKSQDQGGEVTFTVELTRFDHLEDTYSLDIRRVKGNLKSYEFLRDSLRDRAGFNSNRR